MSPGHVVTVRPTVAADAEAVAGVYAGGLAERVATFETEPPSTVEMARRITATAAPHHFLVAEVADRVVGWAATYPYSTRPCYSGVAEFSVYLAPATRGAGVGRSLLAALVSAAESSGLHKVTGRVFVENTASRRLCAAVGFREVGVHRRHARLDGRWRDVITVEILLGDARD